MTLMLSIIIIIILIFIIILQYVKLLEQIRQLRYISGKIKRIISTDSTESILVVTNQPVLQQLLNQINHLLTQQQDTIVKFHTKERNMKRMLSNISHDLKTPLTVILGHIEILNKDKSLNETEKEKMLQQINIKTNEMIYFINTFFDLAKLEAGDKEYPLKKVLINEICKNNLLMYYELIEDYQLEVHADIQEEPIYAYANEEALNRVLSNLLSNAIRYGLDGKIIGLSLFQDSKNVYINVWDQGKGIDAAYQDQVFDRLFTMEESRNKSFQGSGLGLTITKKLVEEMKGSIQLKSTPFEKTVFTITLKRITF